MRLYVQSVTYSFMVNNSLVGPIRPGRGLRQGDLLSLYLFILCAQGLSSLLHNENRCGRLHRSSICRRAPSVSHLLFKDDSLLFYKATREECTTLKQALNLYERASGQAINYDKSGVFLVPILRMLIIGKSATFWEFMELLIRENTLVSIFN